MKVTRTVFSLHVVLVALLLGACGSLAGDACEMDTDCGASLVCDTTFPEGYCTLGQCATLGCSDKGICVHFDPYTSYCMAPCAASDECRDGYECVEEQGPHAFCGLVSE